MINCQGISTGQKPSKRRQSYHINFFRTTSGKAIDFGISSEQEGTTFTYSNGRQDCFLTFKNGRHKKPVFLSLAKTKYVNFVQSGVQSHSRIPPRQEFVSTCKKSVNSLCSFFEIHSILQFL